MNSVVDRPGKSATQLERFKKLSGRLERGFFGFGEALVKQHPRRGL